MLCSALGIVVHEKDVVAGVTYCPECHQMVAVFRTSEARPYNARIVRHELITAEGDDQ